MRKTGVVCLLMAALPALAAPQPSQSWKLIDHRDSGRIELDSARISRMPDGNTAAWSRLSLGFDIPDMHTGERYSAIEALNSYNCKKNEYSTLKRIYLDAKGKPVREEKVAQPRRIEIVAGSFEEKLLPHVCKPRSVGQMQDVADKISQFVNSQPETAKPASRTERPAEIMKVADTASSTKPRLIDLPKIDPSMVENAAPPAKSATKPAAAKASETAAREKPATAEKAEKVEKTDKAPVSPKPQEKITADSINQAMAESNQAAAKAAASKPKTPAPAVQKPEAATETPNYHTGALSRAEIERQLATFGPRKVVRAQPSTPKPAPGHSAHWSYSGASGPENWVHLSPDNAACANGKRQSPINIRDGIRVDLEPIQFNYGPTSYSIIDNGHTVQVNVAPGHTMRIMERSYQLVQFHFHKPAEERVDGRSYDMVAHLVHKDSDGRLAVVAVLLEKGIENPLIQTLWNNLPLEQNMLIAPAATLDLSKLLPEKRDYWTYMGSLTTPPCTEEVLWMVMKQPMPVSAEQLAIFARLYPMNARPVQPANGRLIKESR